MSQINWSLLSAEEIIEAINASPPILGAWQPAEYGMGIWVRKSVWPGILNGEVIESNAIVFPTGHEPEIKPPWHVDVPGLNGAKNPFINIVFNTVEAAKTAADTKLVEIGVRLLNPK